VRADCRSLKVCVGLSPRSHPDGQSAGGDGHSPQGAASAPAEAEREAGGEAALPGRLVRPHHPAAPVSVLSLSLSLYLYLYLSIYIQERQVILGQVTESLCTV